MNLSYEFGYMDLDCYVKRMVLDMIWHAVLIGLVLKDLSRYCKRLALEMVWRRLMDMASDFMRRERKGEKRFWICVVVYFWSPEERRPWSLKTGIGYGKRKGT